MMEMDVLGLDSLILRLSQLPGRIDAELAAYLKARAEAAQQHFEATTPVKTGLAASSWAVDDSDPLAVVISNSAKSVKGFPYPSALITGTGMGGQPTPGYGGTFKGVPGMMPAANLRQAWLEESSLPLATPQLLAGFRP